MACFGDSAANQLCSYSSRYLQSTRFPTLSSSSTQPVKFCEEKLFIVWTSTFDTSLRLKRHHVVDLLLQGVSFFIYIYTMASSLASNDTINWKQVNAYCNFSVSLISSSPVWSCLPGGFFSHTGSQFGGCWYKTILSDEGISHPIPTNFTSSHYPITSIGWCQHLKVIIRGSFNWTFYTGDQSCDSKLSNEFHPSDCSWKGNWRDCWSLECDMSENKN